MSYLHYSSLILFVLLLNNCSGAKKLDSTKHVHSEVVEAPQRQLAAVQNDYNNFVKQQFFPLAFMDLNGFHGGSESLRPRVKNRQPILPLVPLFSNSSKFLGITVPPHYWKGKQNSNGYTFINSTGYQSSAVLSKDAKRFKGIVEKQGLEFFISPEGQLFGLTKGIQKIMGSSKTVGLNISIGGRNKNTLDLRDVFTLGARINFTPNSGHIGKVSGFNLAKGFNTGLSRLQSSYSGNQADNLVRAGISFTRTMQEQYLANARGGLSTPNNSRFQVTKVKNILHMHLTGLGVQI